MMQAQAPVSINHNQIVPNHNVMYNHPMMAHSAHIAAISATAPSMHYKKQGKDTTWTKLFVGGLPYETTDKELREFYEEFGEIEEAVVIIDRITTKSKGYGFVSKCIFNSLCVDLNACFMDGYTFKKYYNLSSI